MNLNNRTCAHCWFWNRFRNKPFSFADWFLCFWWLWTLKMNPLYIWGHCIIWIFPIYRSLRSNRFYSINLLSHWSRSFRVWILLLRTFISIRYFSVSFNSDLFSYFDFGLWSLTPITIFSFCLFLFTINCKITFWIFIRSIRIDESELYYLFLFIIKEIFKFLFLKSYFRGLIKF